MYVIDEGRRYMYLLLYHLNNTLLTNRKLKQYRLAINVLFTNCAVDISQFGRCTRASSAYDNFIDKGKLLMKLSEIAPPLPAFIPLVV